jgi:hypothetical protein
MAWQPCREAAENDPCDQEHTLARAQGAVDATALGTSGGRDIAAVEGAIHACITRRILMATTDPH